MDAVGGRRRRKEAGSCLAQSSVSKGLSGKAAMIEAAFLFGGKWIF
jgi:hypothetical protein